jgi:hypothetical protein
MKTDLYPDDRQVMIVVHRTVPPIENYLCRMEFRFMKGGADRARMRRKMRQKNLVPFWLPHAPYSDEILEFDL